MINQLNSKYEFIPKDLQEKSLLYTPLSELIETTYPYIKKISFDQSLNFSDIEIIECSDN